MYWVLSFITMTLCLIGVGCSEQMDPTKVPPPHVLTSDIFERNRFSLIVKEVQEQLHARGFNPDWPSGNFGPETATSLREYQEREGLAVTGDITLETLDSLGIDYTSPRSTGSEDQLFSE